ncbi:MAG: cytochrome c biogenesis protein CcsA [Planctomycetes bacterium]|jgi:ABC-type transport system involved in cytochrome c biogenesis permease subunit|nr:cytochrome c biogenesis protein CcsA [Planctomycetota bacterium]
MERTLLIPAFGLYLLAAGLYLAGLRAPRLRAAAIAVFGASTLLNLAASVHRAAVAGHFPFSNMFETMMTLGVCLFPFFALSEWGFRSRTGWIEPLLAAAIVFPSAFVFEDEVRPLMPALRSALFAPHVSTYLLAYAAMAKAMILSVMALAARGDEAKRALRTQAHRTTAIGFPLLTAGLLLGAVWAKRAWGDWWGWDPKEVWSLNTWIVYLLYFHVRVLTRGQSRWCDVLNVAGFLCIVITLLFVNLARIFAGIHSYAS